MTVPELWSYLSPIGEFGGLLFLILEGSKRLIKSVKDALSQPHSDSENL